MAHKIDGPVHDPEKKSYWFGPFSEAHAVFDVDGDGHLDITCGPNWYRGPNWEKQEGFRPSASVQGEYINNCGEYAVDVNGDGRTDLVSAGWMKNGVWWYENPGADKAAMVWKATKIVSSDWTEGLVVEDIDGDGDNDVLVNHWGKKKGQGVTWLELDSGSFKVHVLGTAGDEHGMGLGDINGDGRKDILTHSGWYEAPAQRSGEWSFHPDFKLRHHSGLGILVHDVNGDGLRDIIFGFAHNYGLGWFEQVKGGASGENRKLSFREHIIDDSRSQYHTLVLADVNQDGKLDLVTGKRLRGHAGGDPGAYDPLGVYWFDIKGGEFERHVLAYNHLFWYPGSQSKNVVPTTAIGAGMSISVVDLNKDEKVDIVVSGKSGLYLFQNRGLPPTKRMR